MATERDGCLLGIWPSDFDINYLGQVKILRQPANAQLCIIISEFTAVGFFLASKTETAI